MTVYIVLRHDRSGICPTLSRFSRDEQAPERRHQQQRHKSDPAKESGSGREEAPDFLLLAIDYGSRHAVVETEGRLWCNLAVRSQFTNEQRNLVHRRHFGTAFRTNFEMTVERLRRVPAQMPFEFVHYHFVHICLLFTNGTALTRSLFTKPTGAFFHYLTGAGAFSRRWAAFTSFCRARNNFTLIVFSFIFSIPASSSTE